MNTPSIAIDTTEAVQGRETQGFQDIAMPSECSNRLQTSQWPSPYPTVSEQPGLSGITNMDLRPVLLVWDATATVLSAQ